MRSTLTTETIIEKLVPRLRMGDIPEFELPEDHGR